MLSETRSPWLPVMRERKMQLWLLILRKWRAVLQEMSNGRYPFYNLRKMAWTHRTGRKPMMLVNNITELKLYVPWFLSLLHSRQPLLLLRCGFLMLDIFSTISKPWGCWLLERLSKENVRGWNPCRSDMARAATDNTEVSKVVLAVYNYKFF